MKKTVLKQNVGIDIAKDKFVVSIRQALAGGSTRIKSSGSFTNNKKGFVSFVRWVNKHCTEGLTISCCLEATGVYYEQLSYYLYDQTDFQISVILPNKAHHYFKSLNVKSKTDKIDAKYLALMGLEQPLAIWEPLSTGILLLRKLTRERVQLLDVKSLAINRLHALEHSYNPLKTSIKRLKKQLVFVEKQIVEVEEEIKDLVASDESLNTAVTRLTTINGVGFKTASVIIAETDGFKLMTSIKQLISYAGYDVVQKQSGSSVNGKTRISKKGNKYIRRALYFPALRAVRDNENFRNLQQRVFERTKIPMKGYVAVQRKILSIMFTLNKEQIDYDINYLNKEKEVEEQKNWIEKSEQPKAVVHPGC